MAEYGNGLLHKVEDQRIADAAAFAAATAYGASSSNSITSAADAVATINGIPTSAISATLTNSPTGDGNQAVQVSVSTQAPLLLSKVLGNSQANLNVTATSYAEIKGGAPGCIIALNSAGSGVSVSGGTSIAADACAIASNASVTDPCGPTITTIAVDYGTSAPSVGCNGIQPPSGKSLSIRRATTTDPIAGTTELTSATATLTTLAGLSYPGALIERARRDNLRFEPQARQSQLRVFARDHRLQPVGKRQRLDNHLHGQRTVQLRFDVVRRGPDV